MHVVGGILDDWYVWL